jgi:hypothetical protein
MHALSWRIFHSYGLGLLLRAQSQSKWAVRHFLKHYHYPNEGRHLSTSGNVDDEKEEVVQAATEEAFSNWKVIYNISLVMTYGECRIRAWYASHDRSLPLLPAVSFICLGWKTYNIPHDWTVSGQLLRHILGCVSLVQDRRSKMVLIHLAAHSFWLPCTSGLLHRATKSSVTLAGFTRISSCSTSTLTSSLILESTGTRS